MCLAEDRPKKTSTESNNCTITASESPSSENKSDNFHTDGKEYVENRSEARKENDQKLPTIKDLFDLNKPWVLVPNGSCMGHFDYVPEKFRVGPWSMLSTLYLWGLVYLTIIGGIQYYNEPVQQEKFNYYGVFTPEWFYNVLGFGWTFYISKLVYCGVFMDKGAFASYTLQSWTILMIRHGLCAITPFIPSVALLSEALRFTSLVQATVTFTVWNFALMPCIAFATIEPKQRKEFVKFCFHWVLVNLHVLNIVFAAVNSIWGSPARELLYTDLYVALASFVIYALWYLLVLDRIGVHFYFIFSPRSALSVVTWTIALSIYVGAFFFWKKILLEYGNMPIADTK